MNEQNLWQAFMQSGKIEDYLRYRGIVTHPRVVVDVQEGFDNGITPKTASDDRRPHPTEL